MKPTPQPQRSSNNYDPLKKFLLEKAKKIPSNNKEIYLSLKNLSESDLKNLDKNLKNITVPKQAQTSYDILINSIVNPTNQAESFMYYSGFELVEKNYGDFLLKGYVYQILKCSFVGNRLILIHYPINTLNNKKYVCVVSKVDENLNISEDCMLVYSNTDSFLTHYEQIKYNFNNFLQNLGFANNNAPIVINGVVEIGNVIKLNSSASNGNAGVKKGPLETSLYIGKLRSEFPSRPPIGLENIGATCYMNATLQCLCNIAKFVSYFKYSNHLSDIVLNDKKKLKLSTAFKELIENLYPSKDQTKLISSSKTYYAPRHFKDTISRLNPLFEGIAANDAKDLVNFLIMTLHDELNKATPGQNNTPGGNVFQDQTNKFLMFKNFADNFQQNYRSLISDLFYALNYNVTQCSNCKAMSYNYQIYFFLIFPLEEVRKFKLNTPAMTGFNNYNPYNNINPMNTFNIMNSFNTFNNFNTMNNFNTFNLMNTNNNFNMNSSNVVDIYDCFEFEKRQTIMSGENAMYCNYCRQTCGTVMSTNLSTGPDVLIIILNRGKGIEFNVKINFSLELDLRRYIEMQDTGCFYELFGVITHLGESGMGGHFIAYCKEMWNSNWLKFNDAIVSPVNDFKKEVIDFGMPYLLFYQKKK